MSDDSFLGVVVAGLLSGSVIAAVLGLMFRRTSERVSAEVRTEFDRRMSQFELGLDWQHRCVAELLAPLYMQFDRTGRAFKRWKEQNLYLEGKVIREGNMAIRDNLLRNGHLIPPSLREDAGKLIEHYDRWLEEFDRVRNEAKPDLQTAFTFVGPQGYPFPRESENRFKQHYLAMWSDLYGSSVRERQSAAETSAPKPATGWS